jgi:hypothetical protein
LSLTPDKIRRNEPKNFAARTLPKEEYEALAAAPSAGKHFNIRTKYKGALKPEEPAKPAPAVGGDLTERELRARAKDIPDDILWPPPA